MRTHSIASIWMLSGACLICQTGPAHALTTLPPPPQAVDKSADKPKPDEEEGDASALPTEEALGRFQQLLERRPLHAQAFNGLVKHYVEKGKLADLVAQYEERLKSLPDDWATKVVLARLYSRAAQPEKAAELLTQIEAAADKIGKDESKWLVFKAEVFQHSNRLNDAQKVLEQALTKSKVVSEKLRLGEALADLHVAAGKKDKAAETLTALAGEYKDNYLHRKRIADALGQRELHDAAASQYRELLTLAGDKTDQRCETLRQLGRSLEKLGKSQDAINAYSEAVNLLAGGHWLQQELHERIVALYRQSGRLDDLVKYCRDQLARRPEQTGVRVLLADVLAASGDNDAARKTLDEAVQLFPKDRTLSDKRVQLFERIGDSAAAASEYERVISQTPDDADLYVAYGQFLANNKQLDAARNQWKHVLNSELADATLAHRLGALFEPYEMLDDAVECYERAIKLSPARTESYAALARLWFVRGEKEKTIASLKRMAEAAAGDPANHAAVAQVAGGLGLIDEALAAIEKACELQPNSAEFQSNRADLLVQAGRVEDSLKVRRDTLMLLTAPGQLAQSAQVLVSMYGSAGKLDALKAAEKTRVDADAKDTVALLLLARAADFERDFVSAKNWLTKLLEVDATSEEGRHQFARLLEATGDIDGAVNAYRKLIDLHPARARQWYQAIADMRLRYADKAGAIDTFAKIVQTSPGNATVLKDVAEQLAKMGELEKSIDHYEQSLRIQGDRHDIRLAYGNVLADAGRLEDAMAAYRTVAMQKTDRDSANDAMGKLHDVAGRLGALDELIDNLQAQVETDPENTMVAGALAELLIQEYEYSRAIDLVDSVLRTSPRDAELRLVRAEVLRRLTKFDEALDEYRRILRFPNVDRDFVLGEMGKTCFEAGRVDQARTHWRQVGHKLYAGTLLRNNGLVNDAIEILKEGIRLKPDDYGLHRNLIKSLQVAGKVDEALDAARKLLDLEPDNILNIKELAKAYLDRGNRTAAAEIAGRLFSSAVTDKKIGKGGGGGNANFSGGPSLYAMSMQSTWSMYGWGGGQAPRSNLDSGVQFFRENGLLGELQDALKTQIERQPDNALLKETASAIFNEMGKPEFALTLLKDLEAATFPVEQQGWLGTCSQRDFYRLRQYQLIAMKPALRDARLAELDARGVDKLNRDEQIELAVVSQAQGLNDKAIETLQRAVAADGRDVVALSALINLQMAAERYREAEPHVRALTEIVAGQRQQLEKELIERVRRDFVRGLPLPLQLRVTEDLLREIAQKWTQGQSFAGDMIGATSTIGYYRARILLATICAKTERMPEAREIWKELTPKHEADADGFVMLAGIVQVHDQSDLALGYYEKAILASRKLREDPLLQRIYGNSAMQSWWGSDQEFIDTTFNKIVSAFAKSDKLIELYDFLRDTRQMLKAKRIAQQYELYDKLKTVYAERVEKAIETYRKGTDSPLTRSVPLFAAVAKLAELSDHTGDWPAAQKIYEQYLAEFPDELPLLITLGEVAEQEDEYADALEWEKKHIAAKERLLKRAREWALREHALTPGKPQILGGSEENDWDWQQRWGGNQGWWWGGGNKPLEIWPSWMRIAQLHLALENTIAAGSALERAIGAAGSDREEVANEILSLIKERQLGPKLLPVLRSLAVQMPTDQPVQMAFADSLESNDRKEAALEVYRRMLRRGVSDVGTLAQVKQKMAALSPEAANPVSDEDALKALEAEVAADAQDAGNRLRLARAYYYSLEMDKALVEALKVFETAPHLKGIHDLLVEIHTVKGDSEKLIEALRTKIARTADTDQQNVARRRLVDELFAAGKTEDALKVVKELADPKDPNSYERVGVLLHYFGKHDEAIQQFELASKSQQASAWNGDRGALFQVRSRVIKGDLTTAAKKLLDAVEDQQRQQMQYGGMQAMYGFGDRGPSPFTVFQPLFVLEPDLAEIVRKKLVKAHDEDPDDPLAARTLLQFHKAMGMSEPAEKLLASLADRDIADQSLITGLIEQAVEKRQYDRAIEMAEKFIAQQPKPVIPPGMPPQMIGMLNTMSPRNMMLCKLGDIHWKRGEKEKAFEAYKQILDEKVDESRMAYAAICMMRERMDEARKLVNDALAGQEVKSPGLLQFHAVLAALNNEPEALFDDMARATEIGGSVGNTMFGAESAGNPSQLATIAKELGLIDRFVEFMNKRIEKNPNEWSNYSLLASTLRGAGRPREAFAVYERAGAIKSLRQQALNARIAWLDNEAAPDQLVPLYQEAVTQAEKQTSGAGTARRGYSPYSGGYEDGESTPQRTRWGDLLWNMGERDKAVQVWTERLDPKAVSTHLEMAKRFEKRRAYDRLAPLYRKALEIQPNNSQAHRALAELEFKQGNLSKSLDHMREVFLQQYAGLIRGNTNSYPYQWTSDDEEDNQPDPRDGGWQPFRWMASEIAADPGIAERLKAAATSEDRDARLALAVITGDWATAESELSGRLSTHPYDPMVWRLWARVQERKGEWAQAIEAWEKLRRLKQTTLNERRDQLKIALAGKQVKEAAAGLKDEEAGAGSSGSPGSSYRSYSYYNQYEEPSTEESQRLIGLYLKLGDFQKAEYLRLVGQQSNLVQALPELSSVMWRRGAKERSVELSRLAMLLAENLESIGQYAGLLAESGRHDAAIDLLIRAYRCQASDDQNYGGFYAMMYGGNRRGGHEPAFESSGEQQYGQQLFDLCKRHGKLEPTIQRLRDLWSQSPDDSRLGKLTLSLLTREHRWDQARQIVESLLNKKKDDLPLLALLMRVQLQLHDWSAAEKSLAAIRGVAPESARQWRAYEAFCRLMQNDRKAAVAAIEPLLGESPEAGQPLNLSQMLAVLGAPEQFERLVRELDNRRSAGELRGAQALLLARIDQLIGNWDDAAKISFDEFWSNRAVLAADDPAFEMIAGTIRGARAAKSDFAQALKPAENAALAVLLNDGPAAGVKAFQQAVAASPENLNARRGLILASELAVDWRTGDQACAALVEWLTPRRKEVWQKAAPRSLHRLARRYLEQMKSSGLDTGALLAMSAAVGQVFERSMNNDDGSGAERRESIEFDLLWEDYQAYRPRLTFLAGDSGAARKILVENAQRVSGNADDEQRNRYYAGGYYRHGRYYNYNNDRRDDGHGGFKADADGEFLALLRSTRQYPLVLAECDRLGPHLPDKEWQTLADVCATLGRKDDALRWQRRIGVSRLLEVRACDEPILDTLSQWGWYSSGTADEQDTYRLRNALRAAPRTMELLRAGFEAPMRVTVGQLAAYDQRLADELMKLGDALPNGCGNGLVAGNVVTLLRATGKHKEAADFVERAAGGNEWLSRSGSLSDYLQACYEAPDFDRASAIIETIAAKAPALADEVALARLMILRHREKAAEADALERDLVAKCRRESRSPARASERILTGKLADVIDGDNRQNNGYRWNGNRWAKAGPAGENSIQEVAHVLGVGYAAELSEYDLTLGRIAESYAAHGHYSDAVRMARQALKTVEGEMSPVEALEQKSKIAKWLALSGKHDEARKLADECSTADAEMAAANPFDLEPSRAQVRLLTDETIGTTSPETCEIAIKLSNSRPGDLHAQEPAARVLFAAGRHAEAWERYKQMLARGEAFAPGMIFRAGLAAARSGNQEEAAKLLREGLWISPRHPLAAAAREVVHD